MFKEVLNNLNIDKLNEMQLKSIDANKKSADVLLLSPTGSGKTLGFLLPVLEKLEKEEKGVQALIIVPSRELALQIEQVFKQMGTGFKVNCCYGGHDTKIERNNLNHPPAVLVGTPGRLAYHFRRSSFDLNSIHTLVLDEFDKALEFGFEADMAYLIRELKNVKKKILTSATKAIDIPAFAGVSNPVELNFLSNRPAQGLQVKKVISPDKDKLETLFALICKLGKKATLVFCNHRDAVERVSDLLKEKGIVHDIFHGGMEQEDRELALIKFRNRSHHLLITTDLASRGLDIPEIENVIHFQHANTPDAFVHRNGRTARMHASGTAYIIMTATEKLPPYIKNEVETEDLPVKVKLPAPAEWVTLYIAAGKKDKINKIDIVGHILQKGKLEKNELGVIEVLDYSSYAAIRKEKAEKVLQLIKDEKIKKKSVKIEIAR